MFPDATLPGDRCTTSMARFGCVESPKAVINKVLPHEPVLHGPPLTMGRLQIRCRG